MSEWSVFVLFPSRIVRQRGEHNSRERQSSRWRNQWNPTIPVSRQKNNINLDIELWRKCINNTNCQLHIKAHKDLFVHYNDWYFWGKKLIKTYFELLYFSLMACCGQASALMYSLWRSVRHGKISAIVYPVKARKASGYKKNIYVIESYFTEFLNELQ